MSYPIGLDSVSMGPPTVETEAKLLSSTVFRSLRIRLLLPLLATCIVAAILVAILSAWLGARWARQNVEQRFAVIDQTLRKSSFPLTPTVLELLADLTETELVTLNTDGRVSEATLPIESAPNLNSHDSTIKVGGKSYSANVLHRISPSSSEKSETRLLVLFDQAQIHLAGRRAALWPLITGLSTIILLGTLSAFLSDRLVNRLRRLQHRVESVASGNFDSRNSDIVPDEVGRLSSAVDSMASQLKTLWQTVERQQSEKLLHQIAGGMAHQLRNSLTGARMALELHNRHQQRPSEEVKVALHELEQAEDYIRRLLLVGRGPQAKDQPSSMAECLHCVQSSFGPIAAHRKATLRWQIASSIDALCVKDGPTLVAALTNLILNGLQAGSDVLVTAATIDENMIQLTVSDNGSGVPEEIATSIFEPFVSSKPEGMGLGLPLVKRAAEHLEGSVDWKRQAGRTEFRFVAKASALLTA